MNEEKNEVEIELKTAWAVIDLPESAVKLELKVDIYLDGRIATVGRTLEMQDLKKAFRRGEDYIDDEDRFRLTEKGRELFEELEKAKEKRNEI